MLSINTQWDLSHAFFCTSRRFVSGDFCCGYTANQKCSLLQAPKKPSKFLYFLESSTPLAGTFFFRWGKTLSPKLNLDPGPCGRDTLSSSKGSCQWKRGNPSLALPRTHQVTKAPFIVILVMFNRSAWDIYVWRPKSQQIMPAMLQIPCLGYTVIGYILCESAGESLHHWRPSICGSAAFDEEIYDLKLFIFWVLYKWIR